MSQHFRVAKLLSDEHWPAFHTLANDRRTTINDLHGWLVDHGYTVSRGAVWNYARHYRRGMLSDLRAQIDGRSDADLRARLAKWATKLSGAELVSLAFQAAFLAGVEARRGGRKNGFKPR